MSKGTVRLITDQINGLIASGQGVYARDLMNQRAALLTNGYMPPIPHKFKNQRQIRKAKRQSGNY